MQVECVRIALGETIGLSGLFMWPDDPMALYVFAHGAGAGMTHSFMDSLSHALARHSVATLRFNFPFMEAAAGKRFARTDRPEVAHDAIRAACSHAHQRAPHLPLFAGGKSFGARMTSQAQALSPIAHVRGLIFVGFPLHPAKKPATTRADHLRGVGCPMLFLQGARDALADIALVRDVCASLPTASLHVMEGADHGFAVLARSGRSSADVIEEIGAEAARWIHAQLAN